MNIGIEERRVAIEAIATLVNIKSAMAELILKQAGVPREIYQPLLHRRDESTGRTLSKRQLAPLIIAAVENLTEAKDIIHAIISITANWSSFHLAVDEYAARATVQKAKEVLSNIILAANQEAKDKELSLIEQERKVSLDRAELLRKESALLLFMFEEMHSSEDPWKRGYLLQDLLNRTFDLHQINVVKSFTRNEGAEQIDGAFRLEGWHYLVECRWRKKLADIRELDGLKGQIDRSGKQTMGLFLSVNGWSENVPPLLKQNPEKSIILMDGYDLRCVLNSQINLRDFMLAKVTKLNLECEPFLGMPQYLKEKNKE